MSETRKLKPKGKQSTLSELYEPLLDHEEDDIELQPHHSAETKREPSIAQVEHKDRKEHKADFVIDIKESHVAPALRLSSEVKNDPKDQLKPLTIEELNESVKKIQNGIALLDARINKKKISYAAKTAYAFTMFTAGGLATSALLNNIDIFNTSYDRFKHVMANAAGIEGCVPLQSLMDRNLDYFSFDPDGNERYICNSEYLPSWDSDHPHTPKPPIPECVLLLWSICAGPGMGSGYVFGVISFTVITGLIGSAVVAKIAWDKRKGHDVARLSDLPANKAGTIKNYLKKYLNATCSDNTPLEVIKSLFVMKLEKLRTAAACLSADPVLKTLLGEESQPNLTNVVLSYIDPVSSNPATLFAANKTNFKPINSWFDACIACLNNEIKETVDFKDDLLTLKDNVEALKNLQENERDFPKLIGVFDAALTKIQLANPSHPRDLRCLGQLNSLKISLENLISDDPDEFLSFGLKK